MYTWKSSEAANLLFQSIFVLNSVKHRFFRVSIVNTKILIDMEVPLILEYHDLFLKYFLRFTYKRKLWDYWFPWLPDLLKKGLLYFNVYRETKSFFDICLIIQNLSFESISRHFNSSKCISTKNHVNFQDSSGPKTLRKRTGVLTIIVCICIWVANKPNDKKISRNSETDSLCFILSLGYNGYKKLRQPLTYTLLLVLGIWPRYICKTKIHVYIFCILLHTCSYFTSEPRVSSRQFLRPVYESRNTILD